MEKQIHEVVAEKLSQSGKLVEDTIVDVLVDLEIDRRVQLIIKALSKLEILKKSLVKVDKNDIITYSNSKPIEAMSKEKYEKIKGIKEKILLLESTINDALEKNEASIYNKLENYLDALNNAE